MSAIQITATPEMIVIKPYSQSDYIAIDREGKIFFGSDVRLMMDIEMLAQLITSLIIAQSLVVNMRGRTGMNMREYLATRSVRILELVENAVIHWK